MAAAVARVAAEDIRADFPEASVNVGLIDRCTKICNDYRLSATDLQITWELLTMNKGSTLRMSLEALTDLEDQVKRDLGAKRQKIERKQQQQQNTSRKPGTGAFTKDTAHLLSSVGVDLATPMQRRPPAGASPVGFSLGEASPGSAFSSRTDSGKVVVELNRWRTFASSPEQLEVQSTAAPRASELTETLMWERLDERARLLDGQVASFERALAARDDLPPVVSVVTTGADEVTVVGRVCCEGEGKLNVQSLFLEGSRASSNACRVRVDLRDCAEYALFPGQVVGIIGINAVGHTIVAKRVLPSLPPRDTALSEAASSVAARTHAAAAGPVAIAVAAGPYTTTDDLTYAPLRELVLKATEERPDCLVLLGPFVDEQHPQLLNGELPVTYEELFHRQVVAPLTDLIEQQLEADAPKVTHVVLLPSPKDIHQLSAYPQPALRLPESIPEHVRPYLHSYSNPASFQVGSLRVAAASVDALMLLGSQEMAKAPPPAEGAPKPDRMARLASHLLQQRHLLPLFPTPFDERNPLPVDVTANLRAGGLPVLPDVLITPSELAPFAKLGFGGVLCVNPGRLTRKAAGGNYASVSVHPPSAPEPEPEGLPSTDEVAAVKAEGDAAVKAEGEAEKAAPPADALLDSLLAPAPAAAPAADVKPVIEATAADPYAAPIDAPREMMSRAFVEIKRI